MAKTAVPLTRAESILEHISSEFREIPGLRLTVKQAQRIWSLDESTCQQLLQSLVERRFLCRNDHGIYMQSQFAQLDEVDHCRSAPPVRDARRRAS